MELVLKQPKNKPPFIGIVFTQLYEAGTKNQDLIDALKDGSSNPRFTLQVEAFSNYCDIRLACDSPIGIRFYNGVKYDPQYLERWFNETRFKKPFNFAHLLIEGENHMVAKTITNRYNFVFKIENITIKTGERSYID